MSLNLYASNFSCVDNSGIELLNINYDQKVITFALEDGSFEEAAIIKIKSDNDTYRSYIEVEAYTEVPSSITNYTIEIDLWDGIVEISGEEEEDGPISPWGFVCFEA